MTGFKSYVICTAPRSGSTLLCEMLKATGQAGVPASYFHRPSLDVWAEKFDVSERSDAARFEAVLEAVRHAGTGATGVFGLRLQAHSRDYFFQRLQEFRPAPSDLAALQGVFGTTRFVWLRRADKLAQAVSLVKAEQTGLWHRARDGSDFERIGPPADPEFDADRLLQVAREMVEQDLAWWDWFAREGIEPLELTYENLAEDPSGVLRQVLESLDLNPALALGVVPGVAKLADAVSLDWLTRLRALDQTR